MEYSIKTSSILKQQFENSSSVLGSIQATFGMVSSAFATTPLGSSQHLSNAGDSCGIPGTVSIKSSVKKKNKKKVSQQHWKKVKKIIWILMAPNGFSVCTHTELWCVTKRWSQWYCWAGAQKLNRGKAWLEAVFSNLSSTSKEDCSYPKTHYSFLGFSLGMHLDKYKQYKCKCKQYFKKENNFFADFQPFHIERKMRHQKPFLTIQSETAHSISLCKIIMKGIYAVKE